jgi:hypothetical protein
VHDDIARIKGLNAQKLGTMLFYIFEKWFALNSEIGRHNEYRPVNEPLVG